MELPALMGLLIILLLALLFRQWRELAVRRVELGRQLAKRERLLEQFKQEIDGTTGELDEIEKDITSLNDSVEGLQREADELEQELQTLKQRPRDALVILDRLTLQARTFWEVQVSNPGFAETAAARLMPARCVQEWVSGRLYLVGAETAEEAVKRVTGRFSPAMGYQLGRVAAFRHQGRGR